MTLRRASIIGVGGAVALVLGASGAGLGSPQSSRQRELANVSQLGAALSEYNDGRVQALAAYYYSQRSHDSRWLLIEFALSGRHPAIVRRTEIALVTPAGRSIPLATQREWGDDVGGRQVLQEARTQRHQLRQYFPAAGGSDALRFFGRPELGETVIDAIQVAPDQVMYGDLMFASPTGLWDAGSYVLVVEHDAGAVQLPIDLR